MFLFVHFFDKSQGCSRMLCWGSKGTDRRTTEEYDAEHGTRCVGEVLLPWKLPTDKYSQVSAGMKRMAREAAKNFLRPRHIPSILWSTTNGKRRKVTSMWVAAVVQADSWHWKRTGSRKTRLEKERKHAACRRLQLSAWLHKEIWPCDAKNTLIKHLPLIAESRAVFILSL